jgi:hypothetical protein
MAAWQKLAQWRLVFIRSWFISVAVFQKPSDDGAGIGRGHAILAGGGASTVAADFLPGALVVVLALDVTGEAVFVEYHGLTWAHEGDTVTGQVDGDLAGRAAASTAELRVGARIMVRALLVAGIQCVSRACWDVGELGFTSFLPNACLSHIFSIQHPASVASTTVVVVAGSILMGKTPGISTRTLGATDSPLSILALACSFSARQCRIIQTSTFIAAVLRWYRISNCHHLAAVHTHWSAVILRCTFNFSTLHASAETAVTIREYSFSKSQSVSPILTCYIWFTASAEENSLPTDADVTVFFRSNDSEFCRWNLPLLIAANGPLGRLRQIWTHSIFQFLQFIAVEHAVDTHTVFTLRFVQSDS